MPTLDSDSASLPDTVRRAPYVFLRLADESTVELASLLRGELSIVNAGRLSTINPFTGGFRPSSVEELQLLLSLPADKPIAVAELLQAGRVGAEALHEMILGGVLVAPSDDRWLARSSIVWHPIASLFHACSLHEGDTSAGDTTIVDLEDVKRHSSARTSQYVRQHGPPPPPQLRYVPRKDSRRTDTPAPVSLPMDLSADDAFFRALADRRTRRHFDSMPLALESLSTMLHCTFGVRESIQIAHDYSVFRKSSPSGGGMHPIEAFPLVLNVESIEPGLYHYNSFSHQLEPIRLAPAEALRSLVVRLTKGQAFTATASFVVLLVARLGRNFWKYRGSCRTFGVILQDAGHLSQTFYLTSSRLGLGAFYTAALSGHITRGLLGIDDAIEAPVGVCGCGPKRQDKEHWIRSEAFRPQSAEAHAVACETRTVVQVRADLENPDWDTESGDAGADLAASDSHFRGVRLTPPIDES